MMQTFTDVMLDRTANTLLADFLREQIRDIVTDPGIAEQLTPETIVGCKRLTVDTEYYETFNRDDVDLIDLRSDPVESVTATGIRTSSRETSLDALVLATGFDAMTGAITKIDPVGVDARTITDAWRDGPTNFLGLCVPGFPNLFTITGPGSPSVLTNMVVSIEQHVEWIGDLLVDMRDQRREVVEAEASAAEQWGRHVDVIAGFTLFSQCNSWYLGANVPGKPRSFMPLVGFPDYEDRCRRIAAGGYPGFRFS